MENLREAYLKARRGKSGKAEALAFQDNLEANLQDLRNELLSGEPRVGDYHYFTIHDPKERRICAASFRERVLHHALMNVCEPVFEKRLVSCTYACRKGKGSLKAVEYAQQQAGRYKWFMKMDIRKYFDSIDHGALKERLRRLFKDPYLLRVFDRIIDSYCLEPGKGLPIGNLTSQHFANYYLDALDRHVKEVLRFRGYARYMDDFMLWSDDRDALKAARDALRGLVEGGLLLRFKHEPHINRTEAGMNCLGFRVFPEYRKLNRRSRDRFRRKLKNYGHAYQTGEMSELELQHRVSAMLAFVCQAETRGLRRQLLGLDTISTGSRHRARTA